MTSAPPPLLEVSNLRVEFKTPTGIILAVRGLSFELGRERLGIVGESGSGKSMTARAILDLVPPAGTVSADRLAYRGRDMLAMSRHSRRKLRGRCISMVMQDPKFSLNPVQTVGAQIAEAYRTHRKASRAEAAARAVAMLETVQIRSAGEVYHRYPHQVSGGMGQRVMLAMMLIAEPDILIADEATSALDVTVQQEILGILDRLVTERGMGLVFISHDLPLVRSFCDRVIVMYGGKVLETLAAAELGSGTHRGERHPYTLGLLECMPELGRTFRRLPTLDRDPAWLE